jgi:hypothetical protein
MAQSEWIAERVRGSSPSVVVAPDRWQALRTFVLERYFTLDRRSLGLFRVVFGLLLICDLLYRARGIRYWYVNDGLMPNHVVLWAKPTGPLLSLFFTLSSYQEAAIGFLICGLIFVAYTLGYHTKLCQVLAFVAILSLNGRLHMLENGGDIVVNILACLTLFLPLGDRFSLDALRRARLRSLGARPLSSEPEPHAVVSVACFALILQLALIYLFNVLHKSGASWMDGSAVHYTLHQDRLVTSFGVWLREHMPYPALQGLTWGTLAVESLAVVLLLSPCETFAGRAVAALLVPSLHLGFASCLDLGPFPYVMMCFFIPMIPTRSWQWLAKQRCLIPANRVFRRSRRHLMSLVQRLEPEVQTIELNQAAEPAWPREVAASLVLISILFAVSQTNAAVPDQLRVGYPSFARSIIDSTRMFQGWRMFAPEAPFEDFAISVDAVTVDGRHVDPYNEVASPNHPGVLHDIPAHLGQDQYFTSYSLFLPNDNFKGYHHILKNWILDYPLRTKRLDDSIVSFKVKQIIDSSPPPGQTQPSNVRERELFHYP